MLVELLQSCLHFWFIEIILTISKLAEYCMSHNDDGVLQILNFKMQMQLRLFHYLATWWSLVHHYIVSCPHNDHNRHTIAWLWGQRWKFAPVRQSVADNFGGRPGNFCWFFFNFMFMIWDWRHGLTIFDWVTNTVRRQIMKSVFLMEILRCFSA